MAHPTLVLSPDGDLPGTSATRPKGIADILYFEIVSSTTYLTPPECHGRECTGCGRTTLGYAASYLGMPENLLYLRS